MRATSRRTRGSAARSSVAEHGWGGRCPYAMTVKVEGRQWAWGFTYPDQSMFKLPDGTLLQAGEQLDIPVGQKIKLELTAKDVIHSFWVPNIGGKKDAVPGHTTTMWIQADQPGTYKGQCFQSCGDAHPPTLAP